MTDLLPADPLLAGFLIASFVLAVTPGPGVLYIVTRSIAEGRSSGLASVSGVALGNLVNAIGASLGIAAIFAVSALAFSIVKYTGAAYLIYLGVQALRTPVGTTDAARLTPAPRGKIFRDGFLVALLNPKTAMFFAAFLPQFMHTDAAPIGQSMLLGAMFVAMAMVTDSLYVLAASAIGPMLARRRGGLLGRYISGCTFIGLGLLSAFGSSRQSR